VNTKVGGSHARAREEQYSANPRANLPAHQNRSLCGLTDMNFSCASQRRPASPMPRTRMPQGYQIRNAQLAGGSCKPSLGGTRATRAVPG